VNDQEPRPCADITAADWLGPRLRRFGSAVAAVVPGGFPAYVRILHSALRPDGQPVRWAEVAAWSGRGMHRLAQFHAISRPAPAPRTGPAPWDGEDPPDGNRPAELLRILCATLAQHTSTPDPAGSASGTATAGCTAAPRSRSCVASEIDLFCTLVAGSDILAVAMVGDPRLEAWRVQPADPIAFDTDQINT
jgi:hypothetical protein